MSQDLGANRLDYIPHTPHDRISYLLSELSNELSTVSQAATSPGSHPHPALKYLDDARTLIDGYDNYLVEHSSPHPAIVERMLKDGNARDWEALHREGKTQFKLIPEMSAGGYEAVFLQQLACASKAKAILEIGMFTGTTTISLAMLPTVEKVTALEIEPFLKELNQPYFEEAGVVHKIDIRIDDALKSLQKLHEENLSFDMIYIDAYKPAYGQYFDAIMASPHLLAKDGLIVVDNVAFKGAPWAPASGYDMGQVIDEFNKKIRSDPSVDVVMLPIEDGVSLIRRKGKLHSQ
ncbi:O-methyltransferase-domain-containing protein [Cristinia sonorae]|uniref:O-methyltransferase-domain-containing protein n=1 Tax=Cristinia sonorae TaxID=1940300 RepID=A0A8K0UM77_9AGAR|nr:O-methyltransferase-domain-containing protein [Cristinia sonorae]